MDDLRLINEYQEDRSPENDRAELAIKLWDFKSKCEQLGLRVHEKPGKLIWPTTAIDWLGWEVDTVSMTVRMTEAKALKGMRLCKGLMDLNLQNKRPLAKHAM